MGFMDGFLKKMQFGDPDDDGQLYDEYDDDAYDEEDEVPSTRIKKKDKIDNNIKEAPVEEPQDEPVKKSFAKPARASRASKTQNKSSNSRIVRMGNLSSMEVCVIKPTNVEDGREIANTLLEGKAVVLNLEGIDVDLAQRIIDFTSGACFAINGNLQKVSNFIFIITPEAVDISGDFQGYISTDGSFAQDLRF